MTEFKMIDLVDSLEWFLKKTAGDLAFQDGRLKAQLAIREYYKANRPREVGLLDIVQEEHSHLHALLGMAVGDVQQVASLLEGLLGKSTALKEKLTPSKAVVVKKPPAVQVGSPVKTGSRKPTALVTVLATINQMPGKVGRAKSIADACPPGHGVSHQYVSILISQNDTLFYRKSKGLYGLSKLGKEYLRSKTTTKKAKKVEETKKAKTVEVPVEVLSRVPLEIPIDAVAEVLHEEPAESPLEIPSEASSVH